MLLSSSIDWSMAGRRVGVALSGGVDSAVAAALLKQGGAEVVGLTMLLQKSDRPDDAVRVAAALDIPLHIIDLTERFASCVMQTFANTYKAGQTPNPCVVCNRNIKFGDLMQVAKDQGMEALATGHYVRRIEQNGMAELHRALDMVRDQSYFLFALTQAQIDFARFPLGNLGKAQTREIASQLGLPVAAKPDSQDICFVSAGDYAGVVERLSPGAGQSGEIVDPSGRVLGRHNGIIHFTIGQRRGLAIGNRSGDSNEPLYVLRLDAGRRQVVVGPREALAQAQVKLRNVNWLAADVEAANGVTVTVKLRSTQEPVQARFFLREEDGNSDGLIVLDEPVYGVSPGQAGVVYNESRLLGGGWITID